MDIEWLKSQPHTIERTHILKVLEWAVRYEYPDAELVISANDQKNKDKLK